MIRGMKHQHSSLRDSLFARPAVSFFSSVCTRKRPARQLSLWQTPEELLQEHIALFDAAERKRLAERCEAQFNYITAERHYRTALAILEKQKSDAFPMSAAIVRALSALYLKTDRLSLACWYARRSMRICRTEHFPMHPESIRCLAFYGALLFKVGHIRGSIRCLKRAYLRAAVNENSLMVLSEDVLDLLADAYRALGNHRRAAYCERLSRRTRAGHTEIPDTLTYLEKMISVRRM